MLEIYWRDCHCEDGSIFDLIILCKIRIICYLFISEFPTFSICVFCLVWAGVLLWFQPCGLHFMPAYHSHLVRSGKQVWQIHSIQKTLDWIYSCSLNLSVISFQHSVFLLSLCILVNWAFFAVEEYIHVHQICESFNFSILFSCYPCVY